MSTATRLITADELPRLSAGRRCELVDGELRIMSPSGSQHGVVAMNIGATLKIFVAANKLGVVFGAETGFLIRRNPDTVRAPDAAFVQNSRIPAGGIPTQFFPGPPDLAVEVISPTDTQPEVKAKALRWLQAGTQLVWVIDPQRRKATIYRPGKKQGQRLQPKDYLDGESLLPGFKCQLKDVFV